MPRLYVTLNDESGKADIYCRRQGKRSNADEEYESRRRSSVRNLHLTMDTADKCRYYAGLGAVGDFSDALILFAYARQSAIDIDNRSYYYECLEDLAKGRKSEELDTQVAMLASQGFTSKRDIDQAYKYFGIDPAHAPQINDEHVKGVYKSRLGDEGLSSAPKTRKQLKIIAEARDSALLRSEASDTMETYEQALSWLELESTHDDDYATTMYAVKVCLQIHGQPSHHMNMLTSGRPKITLHASPLHERPSH
jgi:hypothetical protein